MKIIVILKIFYFLSFHKYDHLYFYLYYQCRVATMMKQLLILLNFEEYHVGTLHTEKMKLIHLKYY